jgi:hypothetical protein
MAKGARASASTVTGTNSTALDEPQLPKKLAAANATGRGRRPVVVSTSSKDAGAITTFNGSHEQPRKLANGYSAAISSSSRTEVSKRALIIGVCLFRLIYREESIGSRKLTRCANWLLYFIQTPWLQASIPILHEYRRAYRLKIPSSYSSPRAQAVLNSGIGTLSPSMARARSKQRVSKEQLATAVRKHFNSLPVNENDAIVNTLYKARTRGMVVLDRCSKID